MVTRSTDGGVEFRFYRPDARQVYLVGDFNDWQESAQPMRRAENGEWTCRLPLEQGVYQFKYLADGQWCEDRAPVGVGWAPFGCNSVTVMSDEEAAFPVG